MQRHKNVFPARYYERQQNFLGDYTPARKLDLDFSNAENPLGCSPLVKPAITAHLENIHKYPSAKSAGLSQAMRDTYRFEQKSLDVLITAGAGAGILLCVQAFVKPDQHVVMPEATFPLALFGATALHGFGRMVMMKSDLGIDLEAMAAAVSKKTAMVFLCNPNNPTGELIPVQKLIDFADGIDCPVVVSEANADYAGITCLDRNDLPENLIIIRSFSKIHGLAGLRAGAVIGSTKMIHALSTVHCPFTVTSLSEIAAVTALGDREHVERSRDFMNRRRAFLTQSIESMGLRVIPSSANTIMMEIPARYKTATSFAEKLAEHGCSVVDGTAFGMAASRFIRICPRSAEDNKAFFNILQQVAK